MPRRLRKFVASGCAAQFARSLATLSSRRRSEEHISAAGGAISPAGHDAGSRDAGGAAAVRQHRPIARKTGGPCRPYPRIETVRGDLAYAARMLRKNPGFAAAAVLTLALGIGANTAIFSICNAVLFKPLPYAEPDRIVTLWERSSNGKLSTVAQANFVDWRNESRSFSDMAPMNSSSFILGGQGEATRLVGAGVSSNFFSLLGVRLRCGRNFLPEEDRPGQNRVAILSHRIWQQRFGADREIVGRHITLERQQLHGGSACCRLIFNSRATPSDFQARSQPDIWVPIALNPQKLQRGTHPLRVVARLKAESGTGAGAGGVGRDRRRTWRDCIRRTTGTRGSRRCPWRSK